MIIIENSKRKLAGKTLFLDVLNHFSIFGKSCFEELKEVSMKAYVGIF